MRFSLSYLFILSFLIIFLTGCNLPFLGNKKMAALSITSNPKAGIFIDGEHRGATPFYDEKLKPGEYVIRLVPEGGVGLPWEARVKLTAGILTVVSRELADTNDQSSGYVLSLEPDDVKTQSGLLVLANPEGSVVSIDSEPKGFAPVAIKGIAAGDHVLQITSPGYIDKSIKAQLVNGYKLNANVQLAKSGDNASIVSQEQAGEAQADSANTQKDGRTVLDADLGEQEAASSPSPSPKTSPKPSPTPIPSQKVGADLKPPYVTILDTPTGWLNVRKTPTTGGEVIKKVNPGESYKYLDSNDSGWYQIKIDESQSGWISSKYAQLHKTSSTNPVNNNN